MALLVLLLIPQAAAAASDRDRYSLAGGCFALQSAAGGKYVTKGGGGYAATAGALGGAEPFRMQATTLGRYVLYDSDRRFLTVARNDVSPAGEPSNGADFAVQKPGETFTIGNGFVGRDLAVGDGGKLIGVGKGSAGAAGEFRFVKASGCPRYPEITTNVEGAPSKGFPRYGETQGFLEGHMHHMAFKFLGGAHCGKPWHRFGVAYALVDCPDHDLAGGCGAVLDNVLYGDPARCHDTTGWPDFPDWPHHRSLTHEQSYYKWIERAHQSGMRVFVNLMVQNRVLCEIYPLKGENTECDDTKTVDIELREAYKLQDYIDAQAGGPGKGFYRIVRNPFEARRVINQGKLAVVLGMEVSEPFSCRMFNGVPTCGPEDISRELDELQREGVVQLEITNKFDNALTGVAGDSAELGTVTNIGNLYATGRFWDLETCTTPEGEHDHSPTAITTPHNDDQILGNAIEAFLPAGVLPVYPPPPHCNKRGLTELGEHAIREIVKRKMIFDPDHMSVKGRDAAMNLLEALDYSGVISSHSWSTPAAMPRIYRLGGVVTPSAKGTEGFVDKWKDSRTAFRGRQYFGLGIGADQNGFATQGGPRGPDIDNPVTYPFKSFDGKQTIHQQTSGNRVYDINVDGVAHYGLYPDWIEDLRRIAGDRIVRDLGRGAEAYLQMWERAQGVSGVRCPVWKGRFTGRGLGSRLRVGEGAKRTLFRAGQPIERNRVWRWCTRFKKDDGRTLGKKRRVAGVFDTKGRMRVVLSTLARHQAAGIGRGQRKRVLRGEARAIGGGVWVGKRKRNGSAFVYGTRGKKVRYAGVVHRKIAGSDRKLRNYVKRAKLR